MAGRPQSVARVGVVVVAFLTVAGASTVAGALAVTPAGAATVDGTAGTATVEGTAGAATIGPTSASGTGPDGQSDGGVCAGTVERPANGTTVVSIQGARGMQKTQPRLLAFGPEGTLLWAENVSGVWGYDVDPMRNGHLFVTYTRPDSTVFAVFDPVTDEWIWETTLNLTDTHDADLVDGGDRILVANMRNYNESSGENEDRLLLYDRHNETVVWEWTFDDHYPESVGGNYTDDWTHVNDVDRIDDHRYLLSPRNFDQVIVVNRTSGDIEMQLGENDQRRTLNHQHNPDYLESDAGTPTMLVADSENDRIVEYARQGGSWDRTWRIGNESQLTWPRDADRLPSGNTLITDSRNNRVFEVTPDGEIVWEVYTPWLPYDAERVRYGGSSRGPTIADLDGASNPTLHGSAGGHTDPETMERCAAAVQDVSGEDATDSGESLTVDPYTRDGGDEDGSNASTTAASGPGFDALAALGAIVGLALISRRFAGRA